MCPKLLMSEILRSPKSFIAKSYAPYEDQSKIFPLFENAMQCLAHETLCILQEYGESLLSEKHHSFVH